MIKSRCLKLAQDIDHLVTNHQMDQARQILSEVKPSDVPLDQRSTFANLAIRLALPHLAISFLWASIFESPNPSEEHLYEYAGALRKAGLVKQSLTLLHRLPSHPKVLLQKALCHAPLWEYYKSSELLKEYLSKESSNEKEHLIANVNLISAQIFTKEWIEAEARLNNVQPMCEKKYPQLYLNTLELQGQLHFHMNKTNEAEKILEKALLLSKTQKSSTDLFIQKWLLLTKIKLGKIDPDHSDIKHFLKATRELGHWETLRDWDYQISILTGNQKLFVHNYFGSPLTGFRDRSEEVAFLKPKEYFWMDPRSNGQVDEVIDLYQVSSLPISRTLHRLLMALSSDFYRPWSLERIFDSLCEGEVYDPFSSHKRFYKQIDDLKKSIAPIKLELKTTEHGYRLRPEGTTCLVIKERMVFSSAEDFMKEFISTHFKTRNFSTENLSQVLKLAPQQCQRHLRALVEAGSISTTGKGRATKYALKAS